VKLGMPFLIDRSHQTTTMPAEIFFPVISDLIDPATDHHQLPELYNGND